MIYLRFALQMPAHEYILYNVGLEGLLLDDLLRALRVGSAEHEDALAREEEGVHVGYADACFGKESQHAGRLAWSVLKLDGEDVGERCRDALLLQYDEGTLGVVADDAIDAKVLRVGYGGSNNLDACLLERVEHREKGATLILDEDG